MNRVILKKIYIKNFGPIVEDEVNFGDFTYFVGRNNAGKSHYLKAIEILLANRKISDEEIPKLQNDKSKPIEIRGYFEGVENFTSLVTKSNHKEAIEGAIRSGQLCVARIFDPNDEEEIHKFGVIKEDGTIHNVTGFPTNLLKVLPDTISIIATADTIDELKNKSTTALGKIKKEVLMSFFVELKEKTKVALSSLDDFLHGGDSGERSSDLIQFETHLKNELMGEFSEVIPSVEFDLPNEEAIAKEMKIFLDDGHKSEIEQKGHGLQRTALLALLRTLAKHGLTYQDRPKPIFLIGEIETFLHPYAQKLLAEALNSLMERYQIITSTHSPFIVSPNTIKGYRRVIKKSPEGTKTIALRDESEIDFDLMIRNLERRGNLEGLFADRVILIEGKHDEGFYQRLISIFKICPPANKFIIFVKAFGKQELRQTRRFYKQMNFDDVTVIADLDYLFSNDIVNLLSEEKIDFSNIQLFRKWIEWTKAEEPSLEYVMSKLKDKGITQEMRDLLEALEKKRIFVLRNGSPEMYYKNNSESKSAWKDIESEDDLVEVDYLKKLMAKIIEGT